MFVFRGDLGYLPALHAVNSRSVASAPGLGRLLERRLLLFTGKGGVGKSTVVAALAVEAARRGMRPLIVELGHRASMQPIFAAPQIGHEPTPVTADATVWACNLELERAIADHVAGQVKVRAIARAITGNRALQGLLRAAPAVREVVMLDALRMLERHETRGRPTWGPILVDLDATGHALMLLDMPQLLASILADGPLRGLVDVMTGLFTDPARTLLNLVTLPAEIPVQETLELHARLARGAIPLGALFVNQCPPPIDPELRRALPGLLRVADEAGLGALARDLELARLAIARDEQVRGLIARLHREVDVPLALLPRLDPHAQDLAALQVLGHAALVELARPEQPVPEDRKEVP